MAMFRQPPAPPPNSMTPPTVKVWISMFVVKANMKRMDPICTRSSLLRVISAVSEE